MSGQLATASFDHRHPQAPDNRMQRPNLNARNEISPWIRWEGMQVYVVQEQKTYQLVGGTGNEHWQEIAAGGGASNFVGQFPTFDDLPESGSPGDYAYVGTGDDFVQYNWDQIAGEWRLNSTETKVSDEDFFLGRVPSEPDKVMFSMRRNSIIYSTGGSQSISPDRMANYVFTGENVTLENVNYSGDGGEEFHITNRTGSNLTILGTGNFASGLTIPAGHMASFKSSDDGWVQSFVNEEATFSDTLDSVNARVSVGPDGKEVLSNVLDPRTGRYETFKEASTWYDGSLMDDSKVDGDIYVKSSGKYFLKSLGDYENVLQKNTMLELRGISSKEILLLKMRFYTHIQLNGYYENGDTPYPIEYILSDTDKNDDGGSVIEIGSIKLVHEFIGEINVLHFGASTTLTNNKPSFQNAINYQQDQERGGMVFVPEGDYRFTEGGIKPAFTNPLTFVGCGSHRTRFYLDEEADKFFDFNNGESNREHSRFEGFTVSGRNLCDYVIDINGVHHFFLTDVRVSGGLKSGVRISRSWVYTVNKLTCTNNHIGLQLEGTDNNNGTFYNVALVLNEIGLLSNQVKNAEFVNCDIEENSTTGFVLNCNTTGISFNSLYLEFNGEEGVNIAHQGGTVLSKNQGIINSYLPWDGFTDITPSTLYPTRNINFTNLMVVTRVGINDNINILSGSNITATNNWSNQSTNNLFYFKESQITSLNTLVAYSNRFNKVINVDRSSLRISTRSNPKTWDIFETKKNSIPQVDFSDYQINSNTILTEVDSKYPYRMYSMDILSNASWNIKTSVSKDILDSNIDTGLYYSFLYKSDVDINVIMEYDGDVVVRNIPSSPVITEISFLIPDISSSFINIGVGVYGGTGSGIILSKPLISKIGDISDPIYNHNLNTKNVVAASYTFIDNDRFKYIRFTGVAGIISVPGSLFKEGDEIKGIVEGGSKTFEGINGLNIKTTDGLFPKVSPGSTFSIRFKSENEAFISFDRGLVNVERADTNYTIVQQDYNAYMRMTGLAGNITVPSALLPNVELQGEIEGGAKTFVAGAGVTLRYPAGGTNVAPTNSRFFIKFKSPNDAQLTIVPGDGGSVPDASTTERGIIELATSLEVINGSDEERAITPKLAKDHYLSMSNTTSTSTGTLIIQLPINVMLSKVYFTSSGSVVLHGLTTLHTDRELVLVNKTPNDLTIVNQSSETGVSAPFDIGSDLMLPPNRVARFEVIDNVIRRAFDL